MGPLGEGVTPNIYLDSNFFIYALEELEPWARAARRVLAALDTGEYTAATSELTIAECLVKPFGLGLLAVAETYLDFLQDRRFFSVVPITRDLLADAARIRAVSRIKLPDALHAATALQRGCSAFLTNDDRLKIPGIRMLRWGDLEEALGLSRTLP